MTGKKGLEVFFYSNLDKANRSIAKHLIKMILDVTARQKRFTLALTGGNTPRHLYSLLASRRISLTLPVINNAKFIFSLYSDPRKKLSSILF